MNASSSPAPSPGHPDGPAAPLRVAVIGAGPAGFYSAEALIKARDAVSVDIFDRLPAPYGLVRYGVAPDHQKLKSVRRLYERTLRDPRVRYLGHVEYGTQLSLDDLRRHYHAVVFAVGAAADRRLGIPGEDLPGSLSATEFVAWYNGHPDYAAVDVPLDAKTAVVIGMGNVAIDVARALAKHVDELGTTDMADHALARLATSRIEEVIIVGRRGPAETRFTTKELRELGELLDADIDVDAAELDLLEASRAAIQGDVNATKNVEVLEAFARQEPAGKPRTVRLRFLLSPVELQGDGRVERVLFVRNELVQDDAGQMRAVATGELEVVEAQLVLRSVGYEGVPVPGLPFDAGRSVVPNDEGRVRLGDTQAAGTYVAGWIKRGSTGVIGTNKADALETIGSLLADYGAGSLPAPADPTPEGVDELLRARGVDPFLTHEWLALDSAEARAGAASGRPRIKVIPKHEMVRVGREEAGVKGTGEG